MAQIALGSYRAWQIAVAFVAALVGGLAGISPTLGLAAAFGLVYVVLVFQNLALGLALFVGVTFLENVSGVGELSLAKVAGGLLVIGWGAAIAADQVRPRKLLQDHPIASAAILALGSWALLSVAWAELPDVAFSGAQRWLLNLAMFPIVYTAIREPRHVRWVFALFVAGALLSAASGLAGGAAPAAAEARLEGSGQNANELGLLLVVASILAFGLGVCREIPPIARAAAFGAGGIAVLALLTTASRGALVGMAVATIVAPFVVGKGRRLMTVVLIALAVGGAASYIVTVAPASLERVTADDATGSGRTEIWTVGWRVVEDNLVAGVGADNYANSTIHYLFEPGALTRSDFIVDQPKAAHNVYLQVLAELGAIGLALFVAVIVFALGSLLGAARAFARAGDRSLDLLSRALFVGLSGMLGALTFSTAIYSKQLWLLLALSVALAAMARERAA